MAGFGGFGGFSGERRRSGPPPTPEQIAAEIQPEESNSVLGNVGRFLGRPGYALRALLMGEGTDALENLGQMALDLPTLGFLNRNWSLANLASSTGDLTTAEERPEFTDVLRHYGVDAPTEGWGKIGLDVAGGILTDPLLPFTFAGQGVKAAGLALERGPALTRLAKGIEETAAGRAALEGLEGEARLAKAEQLFHEVGLGRPKAQAAVYGPEPQFGLSTPQDLLDEGIRGLESKDLLLDGSALRVGETSLVRDIWSKIYGVTVPGIVQRQIGHRALEAVRAGSKSKIVGYVAEATEEAEAAAGKLWDWLRTNFYDRTLSRLAPPALQHETRRLAMERRTADHYSLKHAGEIWSGIDPEARTKLGLMWQQADETYQGLLKQAPEGADPARLADVVYRDTINKMRAVFPQQADQIEIAMEAYRKAMGEIPDELVKLGVWENAKGNPFYLPLQVTRDTAEDMARGIVDPRWRSGIKDVFQKRRQFTPDELRAHLDALLPDGTPLPGVPDVIETDIGVLMARRLQAHNRTVERAKLSDYAKGLGMQQGDDLDKYLQTVWAPVNVRKSVFTKLLGGGKHEYTLDGERHVINFGRGLNYWYKGLLTQVAPGFHVRNAVSSVVSSFFDPDLGPSGMRALMLSFRDAPLLNSLRGQVGRGEPAVFLRAIRGDRAALEQVQGMKIAGHDGQKVLDALIGGVVSQHGGQADLFQELGRLDLLAHEVYTGKFDKAIKTGAKVSDWFENSFRITSFLELLKKGVDPVEAADRVGKVFVNYERNSTVERFLRDLIPFARYSIGITPVAAKAVAQRPRIFAGPARLADAIGADSPFLPPDVRDTFSVPLGADQYLSGFGLPWETAADAIQGVTSFAGARKTFGGGLQPLVKLPVEAVTNSDFYFGGKFGDYRKPPYLWPDALKDRLGEIPGAVNELLGASPTSRLQSMLDDAARVIVSVYKNVVKGEPDRDWFDRTLHLVTGAHLRNADEKVEMRRAVESYLRVAAERGEVGQLERFFARGDKADVPDGLRMVLKAHVDLTKRKRTAATPK